MIEASRRPIRSFVRRQGRMTPAQTQALERLWETYGITQTEQPLASFFERQAPLVLEIGFGNGQSLCEMARSEPDLNFVGIEVHRPGVGACMMTLDKHAIPNVRLISQDAVEVLRTCVPDASLTRIQIFFPDPWPKLRHHKRRLIQAPFVELLVQKLLPGGHLHLATDWEHYAAQMMTVLSANEWLENRFGSDYAPRPHYRPETKFEQRGKRLGHGVWDLIFERVRGTHLESFLIETEKT